MKWAGFPSIFCGSIFAFRLKFNHRLSIVNQFMRLRSLPSARVVRLERPEVELPAAESRDVETFLVPRSWFLVPRSWLFLGQKTGNRT